MSKFKVLNTDTTGMTEGAKTRVRVSASDVMDMKWEAVLAVSTRTISPEGACRLADDIVGEFIQRNCVELVAK